MMSSLIKNIVLVLHIGDINLEPCLGCVYYWTAWKYLQQLAAEAKYLEIVRKGNWIWVYDNFNLNQRGQV